MCRDVQILENRLENMFKCLTISCELCVGLQGLSLLDKYSTSCRSSVKDFGQIQCYRYQRFDTVGGIVIRDG